MSDRPCVGCGEQGHQLLEGDLCAECWEFEQESADAELAYDDYPYDDDDEQRECSYCGKLGSFHRQMPSDAWACASCEEWHWGTGDGQPLDEDDDF